MKKIKLNIELEFELPNNFDILRKADLIVLRETMGAGYNHFRIEAMFNPLDFDLLRVIEEHDYNNGLQLKEEIPEINNLIIKESAVVSI